MRRLILVLAFIANSIYLVPTSSAAAVCTALNVPTVARDGTTVSVTSIDLVEKTGSFQLTISYKLLNATQDKKIDEGSFKIFYNDGTSTPQYGFFGSLFPSDSLTRSHTWEYLKSVSPTVISYNADFSAEIPSVNDLNWAIPGRSCDLTSAVKAEAEKVAKEKAASDKVEADKADAIKAAAEKAAAEKEREAAAGISLQIKTELNIIANALLANVDMLLAKTLSSSTRQEVLSLQSALKREVYEFNLGLLFKGRLVEMYKSNLNDLNAQYLKISANLKTTTTISCVKGKIVKKVTAIKPVCPKGYKKK
jgi:hypothetical protein